MKTLKVLCLLLGLFLIGSEASAQLSKKEIKEWKKKQKSMSAEDFKDLLESNGTLKGEVSSLQGQVNSFNSRLSDKDAKITELQNELNRVESELAQAQAKAAEAAEAPKEEIAMDVSSKSATRNVKGVEFRVQIGAFKNKDLAKYIDNGESFNAETGESGLQQYTLGYFNDYWEADTFKKYLREMGVKDAWIVPYKDGQRVPMRDVLEGVPAKP